MGKNRAGRFLHMSDWNTNQGLAHMYKDEVRAGKVARGTGGNDSQNGIKKAAYAGGLGNVKKLSVYCLVRVVVLVAETPPEVPV